MSKIDNKALQAFAQEGIENSAARISKSLSGRIAVDKAEKAGVFYYDVDVDEDDYDTISVEYDEGDYVIINYNNDTPIAISPSDIENALSFNAEDGEITLVSAPEIIAVGMDGKIVKYDAESDKVVPTEEGVSYLYNKVFCDETGTISQPADFSRLTRDPEAFSVDLEEKLGFSITNFAAAIVAAAARSDFENDMSVSKSTAMLVNNAIEDTLANRDLPAQAPDEPMRLSRAASQSLKDRVEGFLGQYDELYAMSGSSMKRAAGPNNPIVRTAERIFAGITKTPLDDLLFTSESQHGIMNVFERDGEQKPISVDTVKAVRQIYAPAGFKMVAVDDEAGKVSFLRDTPDVREKLNLTQDIVDMHAGSEYPIRVDGAALKGVLELYGPSVNVLSMSLHETDGMQGLNVVDHSGSKFYFFPAEPELIAQSQWEQERELSGGYSTGW